MIRNLNLLYNFDGDKNVSEVFYLAEANGIGAHYDYAPFGAVCRTTRATRVTGFDAIEQNPFRFSSEFHDPELNLVYYNYRHYSPTLGRFLSRDPIQEQGGLNLYAFVRNNITFLESLGLSEILCDNINMSIEPIDLDGVLSKIRFLRNFKLSISVFTEYSVYAMCCPNSGVCGKRYLSSYGGEGKISFEFSPYSINAEFNILGSSAKLEGWLSWNSSIELGVSLRASIEENTCDNSYASMVEFSIAGEVGAQVGGDLLLTIMPLFFGENLTVGAHAYGKISGSAYLTFTEICLSKNNCELRKDYGFGGIKKTFDIGFNLFGRNISRSWDI